MSVLAALALLIRPAVAAGDPPPLGESLLYIGPLLAALAYIVFVSARGLFRLLLRRFR
ncbi:hypothetical protein JCM2811A_02730 [Methylorubrum rhodinum]